LSWGPPLLLDEPLKDWIADLKHFDAEAIASSPLATTGEDNIG
jgi:hypothetical protein